MKNLVFRYKEREIVGGDKTMLCGIINVTPDSFSDGGNYYGVDSAVNRAKELIQEGASMLDIGGESTRPGSSYVQVEEEIRRVVPVIRELKKITDIPISIDTWKSEVAKAAMEAGADIVNDITGLLGDKNMAKVIGDSKAGLILMFNPVIARPEHQSSKVFPTFGEGFAFSKRELEEFSQMEIDLLMERYFGRSLEFARKYGIENDRIMLDPGIGFGLTKRENLLLINRIQRIKEMGHFTFLGVSRKRFISNILEENGFEVDPQTKAGHENRDDASAILTAIAALQGVEVLRVHTIRKHLMAREIADSVRKAHTMEDIHFQAYQK